MLSDQDRPRLARGVRLRFDPVRETQMLLRPEGALELNGTAAQVVELFDGERTVAQILDDLRARYPGAELEGDVRELIAGLVDLGLVIHAPR